MILYKMEKSSTQSGLHKAEKWILKPLTEEKIHFQYQPLRWFGSHSTIKQQTMEFSTKKEAVNFCKQHGIEFKELPSFSKTIKPKSYTETILNS